MTTYKDVIYMISDLLKLSSDDSTFTNDHILFLMTKFRALLLKNTYLGKTVSVPQSNYQTIGVSLERKKAADIDCSGSDYLMTKTPIPKPVDFRLMKMWAGNYFHNELFAPVTMERMRFIGHNKYLGNIIYFSADPYWKLVLKSCNPQFFYLEKGFVSAVFDNDIDAENLMDSTDPEYSCDILDRRYPLEETLIIQLVEYVAKELGTVLYNPADERNDADDQLDEIGNVRKQPSDNKTQQQ